MSDLQTADQQDVPREVDVEEFLREMAREERAVDGRRGDFDNTPGPGETYPRHRNGAPNIRHTIKCGYSHQAMADLMLMHPHLTNDDLANIFGKSRGWVSMIKNSDSFQAFYARRRSEVVDPEITLTMRERAQGIAAQSMTILAEKLAKPADQVPDAFALRAFEVATKALGMGGNAPPPPPPDPASYLPALADRLMRLQGAKPPVEDAQIVEN